MQRFEYKVVPAPRKGEKARGLKSTEDRFAHALSRAMNDMAREGWEYQRTDTLPVEERSGLTGTRTVFQNMLVFRRELSPAISPHAAAPVANSLVPPVAAPPLAPAVSAAPIPAAAPPVLTPAQAAAAPMTPAAPAEASVAAVAPSPAAPVSAPPAPSIAVAEREEPLSVVPLDRKTEEGAAPSLGPDRSAQVSGPGIGLAGLGLDPMEQALRRATADRQPLFSQPPKPGAGLGAAPALGPAGGSGSAPSLGPATGEGTKPASN